LLENFAGELDSRFGVLQPSIASAVSATTPGSATFMDKGALQPLADLANITLDDCELELSKRFFMNKTEYSQTTAIAKSPVIETMPNIQTVLELSHTVAVSTAICGSSFSTLKKILHPHRLSMLQKKADLILISFEKKIAREVQSDEKLVRRFWDAGPCRRLQLY
jgi:hypothetical protein